MSNMPRHLIQDRYQLYIGGAWCDASDGATFDSFCPANGERLCSFAEAAKSDVDAAVTAAWNAFPSWRAVPSKERSQILGRIADTMEQNLELLAQVESMDTGKPIRETRTLCDVPQSIEHFRYFAGVACGEEGSAVMLDEATMSIVRWVLSGRLFRGIIRYLWPLGSWHLYLHLGVVQCSSPQATHPFLCLC